MNISLLLIEISQNEKGLYKLTFIINKYNMCVCARLKSLLSLTAQLTLYICYFRHMLCFIPPYHVCWGMICCAQTFIGRRVLMTLCFVYIPLRDHNICMTPIIIIAKNGRFGLNLNWQAVLFKPVQPCKIHASQFELGFGG